MTNHFFYYIASCPLDDYHFVAKTHSSEMPYKLHELPVSHDIRRVKLSSMRLSLQAHHLSFLEQLDRWSSEYHYTVYLTDASGNQYQGHVWLGNNDKSTRAAKFGVLQKDGKYKNKDISDKFAEELTTLAETHAKDFMRTFRKKYQHDQDADLQQLEALELELTELSKKYASKQTLVFVEN